MWNGRHKNNSTNRGERMKLTEHGALKEGVSIHEAIAELSAWEEIGLTKTEARALAMMNKGIRKSMIQAYRCPQCGSPIAPGGVCCSCDWK